MTEIDCHELHRYFTYELHCALCINVVNIYFVVNRQRSRVPIHWLWSERALQLCRDDPAGKESSGAPPEPTPGLFHPQHHAPGWSTDPQSHRIHTRCWISA